MPQIGKFISEVWKILKLGGTRLICLFRVGVFLPDSIMDLSQIKKFQLCKSHKLGNLLVELRKLQSVVELDLFGCFKLGRLLDSIVDLS